MIRRIARCALLAAVALGCRDRARATTAASATGDRPPTGDVAVPTGPVRPLTPPGEAPRGVTMASQPRWRGLVHGARPRGQERWRFDLTPKEACGEPATDGVTVFVPAARREPDGYSEGEVYAFDLLDGTLRWHTAVAGMHGEPVEVIDDVVLVDTIPYCARQAPEVPGATQRRCLEMARGAVVGLDRATGRERFRTQSASDAMRARWTAAWAGGRAWVHDGPSGLRAVELPSGRMGARVPTAGRVLSTTGTDVDLAWIAEGRRGTELSARAVGAPRPRWTRPVPYRGGCGLVVAGPVVIVPAFAGTSITGAPRAVTLQDGADYWSGGLAPEQVQTCGAIDNGVFYQVVDLSLVGFGVSDGRVRGRHALPAPPTSDMAVALDGVFYASVHGRLAGVDLGDGHEAVTVSHGADATEGMVLVHGHGAASTRDPGLVIGFD